MIKLFCNMEIEKEKIVYPKEPEAKTVEEAGDYETLKAKPSFIARTSTSADLSGAAVTLVCLHTELAAELVRAFLLYTEASSADGGVGVRVGKANATTATNDYYVSDSSESSKSLWYVQELTLLKKDIIAGDTVTFYSAGSKTGTGEVMLVIEYKIKGVYHGE